MRKRGHTHTNRIKKETRITLNCTETFTGSPVKKIFLKKETHGKILKNWNVPQDCIFCGQKINKNRDKEKKKTKMTGTVKS